MALLLVRRSPFPSNQMWSKCLVILLYFSMLLVCSEVQQFTLTSPHYCTFVRMILFHLDDAAVNIFGEVSGHVRHVLKQDPHQQDGRSDLIHVVSAFAA